MQVKNKTPWLFYGLVAYVLLQFLWWEVLLARQTNQLAEEQKRVSALNIPEKAELDKNLQLIESKKMHQLYMHVGEGTVFLILLSLGVLKIYNTRKKENELARLQNNFLLSVTHELKSPLASIKLQLQTMQKHKLEEATQHALLQKALADNERLQRMIDNILMASKSANGKDLLNIKQVNLSELLFKLVDQAFNENKGRIKITGTGNYFVDADEQFLSIILSNLIENALKYSPENTHVEINLVKEGAKTSIRIKDEGAGIPDHEKQKIFEKFYRIGNEETRSAKGTGLGLYIVKNLGDLHNIQVSVADNLPMGTIFLVKIN